MTYGILERRLNGNRELRSSGSKKVINTQYISPQWLVSREGISAFID